MTQASKYWADWSTRDFAALQACGEIAQLIAVLPVAATEQHGPHLPLSVDTCIVDAVVRACVAQLDASAPVLFLPSLPIGFSPEHARFAGTLSLKAQTLMQLWTDVAEGVAASGVRKLVLLNSHGGQVGAMDMVARDLRARLKMLVYSVSWFNLPLLDAQGQDVAQRFSPHEQRFGVHAGDMETSMMLAIAPERVNMALAQNFASTSAQRASQYPILGNGKSAKLAWQTQDYNRSGAVGDAANATAEKGAALVDAAGHALARMLQELQSLPLDTLVDDL